jgi:hypothetical protein
MLSGVTGGAQWNGVAIARLDPDPTIGSCRHMRASAGAALPQATQGSCRTKARCRTRLPTSGLGLPGDRMRGIWAAGIGVRNCWRVGLSCSISSASAAYKIHWTVSRLARNAAFNPRLPCGTGTSYVVRIFSTTRSIKKLNICSSRSRALMNFSSGSTRVPIFGSTSCQQRRSTQLRWET